MPEKPPSLATHVTRSVARKSKLLLRPLPPPHTHTLSLAFPLQAENILQLELDMPTRTTHDYEGAGMAPLVQAVLDAALNEEGEDLTIDATYGWLAALACAHTPHVLMVWSTPLRLYQPTNTRFI